MKWAVILYGLEISGGANVIFQHALFAQQQGVEVTFVTKKDQNEKTAAWHKGTENFLYKTLESVDETFDVVIATEWRSAFDCYKIKARKYIYFVQSIESRFFFNKDSLLAYVADTSYELPFEFITEASWIRNYLWEKYEKHSLLILNGIDKSVFCASGDAIRKRDKKKTRFLVEGSVTNWLKNVPRTIELCVRAGAEEIWLVTPDDVADYPGVSRVFSRVPISQMPMIYRSCDVLVKLSLVEGMFGPPLEMFHCGGTAITYDIEGSEEYLRNDYNAIVVPKNSEEMVIEAIQELIVDRDKLNRLKANAIITADEWRNWETSSNQFFESVNNLSEISDQHYSCILEKGRAGSVAYRQIENLLGMAPYKNRVDEVAELVRSRNKKLLIFGAGQFCKSTIILLSQYDIEIQGIIVTKKDSNPTTVMGHRVMTLEEIQGNKDDYVIYISTERYITEVRSMLDEKGFKNVI